jgi:TPP-dependent pyruvate/acetoin dehydrogenase alpha subunit
MGTALGRHQSQVDIARKADAYAITAEAVNGMDVLAVEAATRKAVEFVRAGQGPYLLEYRTYRFRAHSMYDAELYRTKDEVAQWKQRDPIPLFEQQLRAQGDLTDTDLDIMETAIAAEIAEAMSFAEGGSWEPLENLTKDVYTPVNSSQRSAFSDQPKADSR